MEQQDTRQRERAELPLLPLRDVVVYPHMVIPLFVGRDKSIQALDAAMDADRRIFLVAQRNAQDDDPGTDDMYELGTVANILQLLKLPDGTVKVLVEGGQRAVMNSMNVQDKYCTAVVDLLEEYDVEERRGEVLTQSLYSQFEQYVQLSKKVPAEVLSSLSEVNEPARLADSIASHMVLNVEEKQKILEIVDLVERLEYLINLMETEIDLLQVEKRVRGRVEKTNGAQPAGVLPQRTDEGDPERAGNAGRRAGRTGSSESVHRKCGHAPGGDGQGHGRAEKLKQMSPMSAEATVVRSYIDWMINVPWKKRSKVRHDLKRAEKILDQITMVSRK